MFQRAQHPKAVGAEARLSNFMTHSPNRRAHRTGVMGHCPFTANPVRTSLSLSPVSSADLQNVYSIIESWLTMEVSMTVLQTGIPS